MSTNATPAAAEPMPAPVPTFHTELAPPFGSGWSTYVAPVPKGYLASARLDSVGGTGTLELNAKPHPPDAPLTIGWYWAGWKRRVSVQLATAFIVDVTCLDIRRGNLSGTWVPRCFVTLRPVAGGADIVNSVVLERGQSAYVVIVAPQSPNLPASVQYDLMVAFNIRASYSGAKNPQGTLVAKIDHVRSVFAFPTLAAGAPEFEPQELAAALADLERDAEVAAIASDG